MNQDQKRLKQFETATKLAEQAKTAQEPTEKKPLPHIRYPYGPAAQK